MPVVFLKYFLKSVHLKLFLYQKKEPIGSFFESSINESTYHFNSINLYNYVYDSFQGLQFSEPGEIGKGLQASNAYLKESQVKSRTYDFTIPEGYRTLLVVR